jgi:hypothetical protein
LLTAFPGVRELNGKSRVHSTLIILEEYRMHRIGQIILDLFSGEMGGIDVIILSCVPN